MWVWRDEKEIDLRDWDERIAASKNPRLECFSWYLSASSRHWGAFFHEETNSRMPVCYRYFLGFIRKVYRPPFSQHMQIIGAHRLDDQQISDLFHSIRSEFSCGTYCSNYHTDQALRRTNLLIDLREFRVHGMDAYTSHHKRRVRKSLAHGVEVDPQLSRDEFLLWVEQYQKTYGKITGLNERVLWDLTLQLENRKSCYFVGARNEKAQIIAVCLYSDDGRRVVNLMSLSNQEGKKKIAMYGIVHTMLQTIMQDREIFDFEGSELEGVQKFYQGFGPYTEPYFELSWNDHFLCKLIHRIRGKQNLL